MSTRRFRLFRFNENCILHSGAGAGFPGSAPAQVVTVQVSLDQDQFLPGESLPATVRVFNNSGQTLHLGADAKWLTFDVEAADEDFVVTQNATPPVIGEFELGSSEVATKRVDLAPYFEMTHAGRYRVIAMVHIAEWGKDDPARPGSST